MSSIQSLSPLNEIIMETSLVREKNLCMISIDSVGIKRPKFNIFLILGVANLIIYYIRQLFINPSPTSCTVSSLDVYRIEDLLNNCQLARVSKDSPM
jgi:hypothetical protein